jgi:osmotically inducible protein OsmC
MPTRIAEAVWEGTLKEGRGKITSGSVNAPYSFTSRFENGQGTNPEELIGAAHAGCFSMALAHELAQAGHPAARIHTTAKVHLEKGAEGFSIPKIELQTDADVPGIEEGEFRDQAEKAKRNCPVSKLLSGAEIALEARLTQSVG